MRIVMFSDAYWPRVNGVTVSVDSFSRALVMAGHEVLIICSSYPSEMDPQNPLIDVSEDDNKPKIVRVPSVPAYVTKEDRIPKFNKWYWVFKKVEKFNPDIIHINTEMMIAEFGFWYARAHNLPAIYTFHTMWEDYGPNYFPMFPAFVINFIIRGILKNVLKRSYRVIVPTPMIEKVVHKYHHKADTCLLPTGIEPGLFDHSKAESSAFREKLEDRFPELEGKRILLFAGRITKEKNISFLLKILPNILAKHKDVVLLLVGGGPDMDSFRNEARKFGIEDACVFTGYVDRRELALIYSIAEIFVFPSLTDTQGLVTMEAMLSGTPVVAIGVLGTLTVMGGDNGGFMVKNDRAEFTARVLELLENPQLRESKSNEAKLYACSWSIEELTKKLVGIYQSTIEDYHDEYGKTRKPVWGLVMNKRWWEINNKIFRKKSKQRWHKMMSRLKKQKADS